MFIFDPNIKRSLRRETTKHETRVERLDMYAQRFGRLERVWVWAAVLEDKKLDHRIRLKAGDELSQLATHDALRSLRIVLHDRTESYELRAAILHSFLVGLDDVTFAIDVRAILADPSESLAMRVSAAEMAHDASCLPLLKVLLQSELDAELAFWCIYACASNGREDPEVDDILERYTEDHRPVDPRMGTHQKRPATVSMEAVWALRQRSGDYCEPLWEIEPDASET